MIRAPWKDLGGIRPMSRTGSLPPRAPRSVRHGGVYRPYGCELFTEWLTRLGLPKSRYACLPPTGSVRIGIVGNRRQLVICQDEDPPEMFVAVYLALQEDAEDVIIASEYDNQRYDGSNPFSRNGHATGTTNDA